jgi:hypothetical protein
VIRVEVGDLRLGPVVAGSWSWGQPDPGGAGEGGSSPDQAGVCQNRQMAQARRAGWRGVREEPAFYVPQSFTGSNLADLGRKRCVPAVALLAGGELRGWCGSAARGGHGEGLRRTHGEAAGTQSGSSFVERITVNTGTVLDLARRHVAGVEGWAGRTDRRSVRDGAEPP